RSFRPDFEFPTITLGGTGILPVLLCVSLHSHDPAWECGDRTLCAQAGSLCHQILFLRTVRNFLLTVPPRDQTAGWKPALHI
ncbi:MAG: hypothetical protein AAB318_03340, partial [Planctomycetota bacterium]